MKYLIIGLGNVGEEYTHTRHNIGFDVANALVRKYAGNFEVERHAYMTTIKIKGKTLVVICPTTFMNLSGKAVKYWMDKEKISIDKTLTVVDDIALPLTKLRIRPGGSDAGHNGLRSIQDALTTTEYPKLRFGIGNDFPKGHQSDFVLGKWRKEEEALVQLKIDRSVEAIETFVLQGLTAAMNQVNNKDYSL